VKTDQTLIQRLLLDITDKYKNSSGHTSAGNGACYMNKLEKQTMIQEINTLAKALIKNEKRVLKMQEDYRLKLKEHKRALKEKDAEGARLASENTGL
jgi:hypothetical protein